MPAFKGECINLTPRCGVNIMLLLPDLFSLSGFKPSQSGAGAFEMQTSMTEGYGQELQVNENRLHV